jgi:glycolate oxidase
MALDSLAFRPRVLRDVSELILQACSWGKKHGCRSCCARSAGWIDRRRRRGVGGARLGAVRRAADAVLRVPARPRADRGRGDNLRVFQLYVRGDDAWTDDFVRRAKDNGFAPSASRSTSRPTAARARPGRALHQALARPRDRGRGFQAGLSWDQVKRYKDKHDLPLILKGHRTVEDAQIAVEHGVEVVYVSNHGGASSITGWAAPPCCRRSSRR